MASSFEPVLPSECYDFSDIAFEALPTRGWVRVNYANGKWGSPSWQTDYQINLPIHALALHYGQAAFEGIRAIRSRDQHVRIFRPQENAKRLNHSADVLSMPHLPEELFLEACRLVVSRNLDLVPPYAPNLSKGSLYLRPVLFASEGSMQLRPANEYIFAIYVTPLGNLYASGATKVPAMDALVVADFDRAAPMGTGSAKAAGNYAPVLGVSSRAKALGFGITLHLDSRTRLLIDEFSTSNFLALKYDPATPEDVTLVVPASVSILKSITTMSAIQTATDVLGWKVDVRPVEFAEVVAGGFQEIAAAGTGACITPVRSVSYVTPEGETVRIPIGDGKAAGPGFQQVFDIMTSIQCGDKPAPGPWLWPEGGVVPESQEWYAKPLKRIAGERQL